MKRLIRRLAYVVRRRHREAELAEEMSFHKELAGSRAFGNDALATNRARDVWVNPWLQDITQDVRFAVHMLRKDKRFTVAAVLALGLGIAVNNSVFTIINAVLVRAVPFEDGDKLVAVGSVTPRGEPGAVSVLELRDLQQRTTAFEGLAGASGGAMNLSEEGRLAERVRGSYISANTFALLRARPHLGRDFVADDDRNGAPSVAILSHGVWVNRYGRDPGVIGRTVKINGAATTIVGVMPQGFTYPMAELWQPLAQSPSVTAPALSRVTRNISVTGRLKSDVPHAMAELEAFSATLAQEYPDTNRDVRFTIRGLKDNVARQARPMLFTMMAAVVIVLLVACANLANLLLARATTRGREIAIRAALGGSRWRIVRQLLIECALLAIVAGTLGHALSYVGVQQIARAFDAMEPGAGGATIRPWWLDTSANGYDYAFVGILCLFAVLAFGLVPSLHMARSSVHDVLKEGGRPIGSSGVRRWASTLMVAELALTLILLTAAGLLWRNYVVQYRSDVGFDTSGLVIMSLSLPTQTYPTPEQRQRFFAHLKERLSAIPTITSATTATQLPLIFFPTPPRQVVGDGYRGPDSDAPRVNVVFVGDRFFETFGIAPLDGKLLSARDGEPGREGVVLSDRVASLLFPAQSSVGRRVRFVGARTASPSPWLTVVGVTPTLARAGWVDDSRALTVYLPDRLEPSSRVAIAARGRDGTTAAAKALREEIHALDPDLPLFGVEPFDAALRRALGAVQMVGTWFAVIAVITLVTASFGLFALTAHSVAQREQEIGIRLALGATSARVVWMFLRRTVIHLLAGLAIGLYGALNVGRFVAGYTGPVSPRDPLTITSVVALLTFVALIATFLAARRAAALDPVVTLRAD